MVFARLHLHFSLLISLTCLAGVLGCSSWRTQGIEIGEEVKTTNSRNNDLEALLEGQFTSGPLQEGLQGAAKEKSDEAKACGLHRVEFVQNQIVITEWQSLRGTCGAPFRGEVVYTGTYEIDDLSLENVMARPMKISISKIVAKAHFPGWGLSPIRGDSDPCRLQSMAVGEIRDVSGLTCRELGTFPSIGEKVEGSIVINAGQTIRIQNLPSFLPIENRRSDSVRQPANASPAATSTIEFERTTL